MIVNCFEINDVLQLIPLPPAEVVGVSQKSDARVWLDIQSFKTDELQEWLDALGVKGLPRRLCLESHGRCGFYPLKNEIFLVMPVLFDIESSCEVDYIAFLCRENLLLTFHQKSIFKPQEITKLQESDSWLHDRSIASLVSAVMIYFSMKCLQQISDLRKLILDLEERMDQDSDLVEAEEILELRSKLLILSAVVSDPLPSLQALSAIDKPFFRIKDAQEYMSCMLANMQAADKSLDWLDGRIAALRAGFQMHAQDKTNRRLGLLTILSAIFMPITLMAGIWGMNFETMPELKYAFAYPMAIGLMVLTGVGMFFYFRKTGWLD